MKKQEVGKTNSVRQACRHPSLENYGAACTLSVLLITPRVLKTAGETSAGCGCKRRVMTDNYQQIF